MTNDLDLRIRELVDDVVASTPVAPSFEQLHPSTRPLDDARTSRRPGRGLLVAAVATVGVAALIAGIVLVAHDKPSSRTVSPAAPIVAPYQVDIASLPTLRFDQESYEVPAGPVRINYVSRGGTHWLAIVGPGFPDRTILESSGEIVSTVVDLAPGEYTIYCALPGHHEAGEQATLIAR
jgi:hypothetical protein